MLFGCPVRGEKSDLNSIIMTLMLVLYHTEDVIARPIWAETIPAEAKICRLCGQQISYLCCLFDAFFQREKPSLGFELQYLASDAAAVLRIAHGVRGEVKAQHASPE